MISDNFMTVAFRKQIYGVCLFQFISHNKKIIDRLPTKAWNRRIRGAEDRSQTRLVNRRDCSLPDILRADSPSHSHNITRTTKKKRTVIEKRETFLLLRNYSG